MTIQEIQDWILHEMKAGRWYDCTPESARKIMSIPLENTEITFRSDYSAVKKVDWTKNKPL